MSQHTYKPIDNIELYFGAVNPLIQIKHILLVDDKDTVAGIKVVAGDSIIHQINIADGEIETNLKECCAAANVIINNALAPSGSSILICGSISRWVVFGYLRKILGYSPTIAHQIIKNSKLVNSDVVSL